MPFDQQEFYVASPRSEPHVSDDPVLRVLIGLRELHSDPARWCCDGRGMTAESSCIVHGAGYVNRRLDIPSDTFIRATDYLKARLPTGARDLVHFNELMDTTHAELMAFYDRAIAARTAELTRLG